MKPPFRTKHDYRIPSLAGTARKKHNPDGGRMDVRSLLCENIHPFVYDGTTPRIMPKRFVVEIVGGSSLHGHLQVLGDEEARKDESENGYQDFLFKCHRINNLCHRIRFMIIYLITEWHLLNSCCFLF